MHQVVERKENKLAKKLEKSLARSFAKSYENEEEKVFVQSEAFDEEVHSKKNSKLKNQEP